MKKLITAILIFNISIFCAFAAPSYLGIEFLKPNQNIITVGATNLSFGNPANDGIENLPPISFTIDYEIQAPGTLFVFFSSLNDLGASSETGYMVNKYMLSSHRDDKGLNYGVSVNTTLPVEKIPEPFVPAPYINTPIEPTVSSMGEIVANIKYLDMGVKDAPHIAAKTKSGVVIRHTFTEGEITTAINGGSANGLVGQDTVTMLMDINNTSFRKLEGKPLPSGLYHGYIIVHYSVL